MITFIILIVILKKFNIVIVNKFVAQIFYRILSVDMTEESYILPVII